MKKLLMTSLIFLMVGLFPAPSYAFGGNIKFCFENDGNNKTVYMFYWIDHVLRDTYPRPMNLAGGELEAGETRCLGGNYLPGKYVNFWQDVPKDYRMRGDGTITNFKVTKDNVRVTIKRGRYEPIIEDKTDEKKAEE